jgi:integrase-like protein
MRHTHAQIDDKVQALDELPAANPKAQGVAKSGPLAPDALNFNGKLSDELLNGEIFDTVLEARVLTERWRQEYNHVRPHSALGYRPPAPAAIRSWPSGSAPARLEETRRPHLQARTVPAALT